MIRSVAIAAVLAATLATPTVHAQTETTPLLGTTLLFGMQFCPRGWKEANGQLLQISQNEALFSLFGTMYGGNGTDTFGLPDLTAEVPQKGMRYCVATSGLYPERG